MVFVQKSLGCVFEVVESSKNGDGIQLRISLFPHPMDLLHAL